MSTHFHYKRTSKPHNIRLIHLELNHERAPLHCELVETSLDSLPRYTALSYVWGIDGAEDCIWIGNAILQVRPNLYGALRNFRARGISVIWADAICINQQDPEEQSAQVRLMTRIFSSADSVMFYMGEWQSNESRELERIFQSILRQRWDDRDGFKESDSLTYSDRGWHFFLKMLGHPWFTRVWTIQESVVARRGFYVYGDRQIDRHALLRTIQYLWNTPSFLPRIESHGDTTKALVGMLRCMAVSYCQIWIVNKSGLLRSTNVVPRPLPVFDLMVRFNAAAALDARDYVHALVGISQEAGEKALAPDYTRSCDAVFFDLARFQVEKGQGLALLYTACLSHDGRLLPSWVPRWDRILPYPLVITKGEGFRFSNIFSASATSRSTPGLGEHGLGLLIVHGKIIDSISLLGKIRGACRTPTNGTLSVARELVDYVAEILRILETCRETSDGEADIRASVRVAFCDGWQRLERADPDQLLDGLRYLVAEVLEYLLSPEGQRELVSSITAIPDPVLSERCKEGAKNLNLVVDRLQRNGSPPAKQKSQRQCATELKNMFDLNYPRGRVGRTTKTRVCYMPNDSLIGDRIALIKGCEVPMVLRCIGGKYCIVGPCYVHGIMYGEIWRDDAPLEEICLA